MNNVSREELLRRDRSARDARVYNHPSSQKLREAGKAEQKPSPAAALAVRQADELGEQKHRHGVESRRLRQRQQNDHGRRLQTSAPLPADYERRHQTEQNDMHK